MWPPEPEEAEPAGRSGAGVPGLRALLPARSFLCSPKGRLLLAESVSAAGAAAVEAGSGPGGVLGPSPSWGPFGPDPRAFRGAFRPGLGPRGLGETDFTRCRPPHPALCLWITRGGEVLALCPSLQTRKLRLPRPSRGAEKWQGWVRQKQMGIRTEEPGWPRPRPDQSQKATQHP